MKTILVVDDDAANLMAAKKHWTGYIKSFPYRPENRHLNFHYPQLKATK